MNKYIAVFISIFLYISVATGQQHKGFMISPDPKIGDLIDAKILGAKLFRYQLHVPEINSQNIDIVMESRYPILDRVVNFCIQNDIKLVIDLHNPPGGLKYIDNKPHFALFWDRQLQNLTIEVWKRIAFRYKHVSNKIMYGYDLLNEPAYWGEKGENCLHLRNLYIKLINEIRKIDVRKYIIVETPFGHVQRIKKFKVLNFPRIIYSVHMYHPIKMTHQLIHGSVKEIPYPNEKYNKTTLSQYMKVLHDFEIKHKAKIYIGEFSCINFAPGNTSYNYIRDVISIMNKYKWDWTYHAWREWKGWSPEKNPKTLDLMKKQFMP